MILKFKHFIYFKIYSTILVILILIFSKDFSFLLPIDPIPFSSPQSFQPWVIQHTFPRALLGQTWAS